MTDADTTRAAALLKGHRESIDRLDAILVYTLGERFKHTQSVGRLKAAHDLPASDPAREAILAMTACSWAALSSMPSTHAHARTCSPW